MTDNAATPARVTGAVHPGDTAYQDLSVRGLNKRFTATPEVFHVVTSTEDVVRVVRDAVANGRRIAVRSGGHGYENVAGDPAVRVVVDLGELRGVSFDEERKAFAVEPGARLADVYRTLYEGWGVTIPAGDSATVGLGGHVVGGGFGSLSRAEGMAADHLLAVEVVVVDASGEVRAVVATRDPEDPHHDLWWAHTGGGGGNFGIVTRYWFRSPGATGDDPRTALPRPPATMLAGTVLFNRDALDRAAFRTLVANYGSWHEANSAPDSAGASLFGGLVLLGRPREGGDASMGAVGFAHVDGERPDAARLLDDYIAHLTAGLGDFPAVLPTETLPWLDAKKALAQSQDAEIGRQKVKSAFLRRGYDEAEADTLYDYLDSGEHGHDTSLVALQSYGGRVNAVAPDATASAQRGSVIQVFLMNTWQDPADDAAGVDWMRRLFRDLYAKSGGVPVPGEDHEGCYINFPDTDMADPEWNTSGVPWEDLYYLGNAARLRGIKAKWDPRGVFRHALSPRADD
ncbi:FAD-dependent oxidoreductase [Streptomyces marincola]|uniref:FAD-linked oxidase n=1 Tax=Streptomyces marincola TaxID=2878388 RepID=A0A1W7CZ41_9ACTN|nr:FAD-binding protein [Streptomyces marincola]ARQ70005.1 FAD-linked oxidase [Streptomyces marincola]